jgi:hypothetical protein
MDNIALLRHIILDEAKKIQKAKKAKVKPWDEAPTGEGETQDMGDTKDAKVGDKAKQTAWEDGKPKGKLKATRATERKLTAEELRRLVIDEAKKAKAENASVTSARTPLEDPDQVPELPWEKGMRKKGEHKHAVKQESVLKGLADSLEE